MSYNVDPELLPWLDMLPLVALPDYEALQAARGQQSQLSDLMPAYEPANPIDLRDLTVPGPSDAPDVPVRVYSPANR
jgi:acetyl esterase